MTPEPKIGEIWVLKPDGSPWPTRRYHVTILNVAPGWVRYWISSTFPDERMETPRFVNTYERTEQRG